MIGVPRGSPVPSCNALVAFSAPFMAEPHPLYKDAFIRSFAHTFTHSFICALFPRLFLEHLLVARHRAPGDTPENQTDNKSLAIVELMV